MANNQQNNEITLTAGQQKVLKQMTDFVFDSPDRIFILKGYAGTGKTTLMKFLIEELRNKNQSYKLLSTTGRAAKILTDHTGYAASTIHSTIYTYSDFNKDVSDFDPQKDSPATTGQLTLEFVLHSLSEPDRDSCVYIVDEASMISDTETKDVIQAKFGSGRLLKELLDYDDLSQSKYIFVGDPCQLPPINGTQSPALLPSYFATRFGMEAQHAELTQIMRQDNSIIKAGEYVRKLWNDAPENGFGYGGRKVWGAPLYMSQFADFQLHGNSGEMEELYYNNIKRYGYADSVFICSSNKNTRSMSVKIRQRLGFTGLVQIGDLLLVTQNQQTTGLMNGDMVEVVDVKPDSECIMREVNDPGGYRTILQFRGITVKELHSGRKVTTLLLDNTLQTDQGNLDSRQQTGLFLDFILKMKRKGITPKKDKPTFDEQMHKDPYLNALRCSYGYAITCHKAQGGEWNSVFVQAQRNMTLNPEKIKYQWFYTAITRAKTTVHLCKDFFFK